MVPIFALPFGHATPGRQPLTAPGSTDAALAVKTERFPPPTGVIAESVPNPTLRFVPETSPQFA